MSPDAAPGPDPSRCPLCGEDNVCGAERGSNTCWCFATVVPGEVVARIAPDSRGKACVCARCAAQLPRDTPETGSL